MSDPLDLAAIELRLAAATPGPWDTAVPGWVTAEPDGDGYTVVCSRPRGRAGRWVANAALVAHAPADLRALLDEVSALRAERDKPRARLARMLMAVTAPLACGHPLDCLPDHGPGEAGSVRCGWCRAVEERDATAASADRVFGAACERLDAHEAPGVTLAERIDGLARQRDEARRLLDQANREIAVVTGGNEENDDD